METPYDYTQQGIVEAWTRRFIPGFRRDEDYEAWRESVGAKKVGDVVRKDVGEQRT